MPQDFLILMQIQLFPYTYKQDIPWTSLHRTWTPELIIPGDWVNGPNDYTEQLYSPWMKRQEPLKFLPMGYILFMHRFL